MLTHKQLSEPESLRSSLIFAKTMSSEEVGDKPEGKGEIFESSAAESVAEGVEGKGANVRYLRRTWRKVKKRRNVIHSLGK